MLPRSSTTVFVIDPDEAVLDSVRVCLDTYGIEVRAFRDGCSFLRDANPQASDCVMVECELPDMSGLALIDTLRGAGSPVPVLLLTSSDEAGLSRQAESRSAVEAVRKPLMSDRLLQALPQTFHRLP